MVDFYNKYYDDFETARKQMAVFGMEYPQTKILDSCFWQIGFDLDDSKGFKVSH